MSDALARPGTFNLRKRYSRIECPEPDYEVLWAEVRTNLSHDERAQFLEASDAIRKRVRGYIDSRLSDAKKFDEAVNAAKSDKERVLATSKRDAFLDEQDTAINQFRQERLAMVSSYIRAWNVVDDDERDVPPPSESGAVAFEHTDDVIVAWLETEIERGYRGGKGVRTRLLVSDLSPAPMSGPQLVSEPEPSS